jgi:hypothetical protein
MVPEWSGHYPERQQAVKLVSEDASTGITESPVLH